MEDRVFQKMMEPFDPAEGEGEQRATGEESKQDAQEENSDSEEASKPTTRAPPRARAPGGLLRAARL